METEVGTRSSRSVKMSLVEKVAMILHEFVRRYRNVFEKKHGRPDHRQEN